jgi:hypothetical protein
MVERCAAVKQSLGGEEGNVVDQGQPTSSAAEITGMRSCRIRVIMLPAGDHTSDRRAEDGREPEQPELPDIGSACKQRGAGASCRIDRGVRDRNQEKMDQRQAKSDGYSGKPDGRAFRGGADDDVQIEKAIFCKSSG